MIPLGDLQAGRGRLLCSGQQQKASSKVIYAPRIAPISLYRSSVGTSWLYSLRSHAKVITRLIKRLARW